MANIFTTLTDLAQQVKSTEGTLQAEPLLTLCRQIVPVIDKFGASLSITKADINGNIERLETARQRNTAVYRDVFQIVLDEVERGEQGEKSSDTKGLLWLKRAMEFVVALLQRLYEDRSLALSMAASEAYHMTLYQFHTWYTSAAFQLALKLVPSREAFLQKLDVINEQALREMHSFIEAFSPILADIQQFLKEHGLDDPSLV